MPGHCLRRAFGTGPGGSIYAGVLVAYLKGGEEGSEQWESLVRVRITKNTQSGILHAGVGSAERSAGYNQIQPHVPGVPPHDKPWVLIRLDSSSALPGSPQLRLPHRE